MNITATVNPLFGFHWLYVNGKVHMAVPDVDKPSYILYVPR